MFPLTITGLRGNLVELYTAAQKGHEIISLPNDTLWDREICIGKFFHWTVSKLNLAPNVLNEVVQTTCLKTHTCFEQVLERVKQDITILNRLVLTAYHRALTNEEYCLQHSILKGMWYWEKKLLCLFRDPKADEILTKIYSELALKGNIAIDTVRSVRKTSLLLKQSKQVRILCRLISQLNYDGGDLLQFPFNTLNHCSLGLPLDDNMEKELREFIRRINIFKDVISYQDLWISFHLLVKIANRSKVKKGESSVLEIAFALHKEGLALFEHRDAKCHEWVQDLMKGKQKEVLVGGESYTISGMLSVPNPKGDNHVIFSLQGHSEWIYSASGKNPFALEKEIGRIQKEPVGIPLQQTIKLCEDGLGAVSEQLCDCIDGHYWPSKFGDFQLIDHERLDAITSWVKQFMEDEFLPKPLNNKHIMFNHSNELRLLKPVSRGEFNFVELEEFLWSCSQSNEFIYHKLCEESFFTSHPWVEFIHRHVNAALSEQKLDLSRTALLEGIEDQVFLKSLQTLCIDVFKVKESLLLMCKQHRVNSPTIEKEIIDRLLSSFVSKKLTLRLPPSFKRALFDCIKQKDCVK